MCQKREKPITKIIVVFILLFAILFLVDFSNIAYANANLMSSLSNLLILLYTSLVAIIFSFLSIHLSRQYGLSSIDILIKKAESIFTIYNIVIIISILGLILDLKTLENFNIEWGKVSIRAPSIMLGTEIIFVIFSAYFFKKYVSETVRITPREIMKTLGYPDKIVNLVEKGRLYEADTKFSRGLSLIRLCITDLSLRDELEAILNTFNDTIKAIPWHLRKEELRGKEKIDISTLYWKIHSKMDEHIFSPLVSTDLKPSINLLSKLFCNLTNIYIDTNLINSSLFSEYLNNLYRVTENYVKADKIEALNYFFFGSVFWVFRENLEKISYSSVSEVLSKGIGLSTSLVKSLEKRPNKKDDIKYILFITFGGLYDWVKIYPKAFIRIEADDLIYLMGKGGRVEIGKIIIALSNFESELVKIKENEPSFIFERAVTVFNRIKSEIETILNNQHWRILLSEKELRLLNVSDKTIEAIQFANFLNEDEVKKLKSFIEKHFALFLQASEDI
jgi:hypothetical protein